MYSPRITRSLFAAAAVVGLLSVPVAANAASVVDGSSGRPLTAELLGANEVGPGDPDGAGTAIVTVNYGKSELCYSVSFSGIETPVGGHVHDGDAGTNGPIAVSLTAVPGSASVVTGCATVDRVLLKDIMQDPSGYYVNVHTADFPGGAIRGQLGK